MALGKGLEAILEDVEAGYFDGEVIKEIEIERIKPNPFQPRKEFSKSSILELAESIKEYGLLQPIIVVKDKDGFILVAGERRLRAVKEIGWNLIKAIVLDKDRVKFREFALIENIQREDLNPIELALSYKELMEEYNLTQEDLAKIVKKSRASIANTLRLLNLSEKTKELIASGKISSGHAKVIVGLDKKTEEVVVNSIIGQNLSVRDTEKLVKSIKQRSKDEKKQEVEFISEIDNIVSELQNKGFSVKQDKNRIIFVLKNRKDVEKFKNLIRK